MHTKNKIYTKKPPFFAMVLLGLSSFLGMGIDLIAPSLPSIVEDFHAPPAMIKGLIPVYLFGYALGTVIVGFLSDTWGRKNFILAGHFLFSLSSLLPLCFPSVAVLLITRFLQGLFVSSLGLSRPIFVDIFHSDKLVYWLSWLATLWSLGAVIGPFIGGYLNEHFTWKACFIFFSSFGFLGVSFLSFLSPETQVEKRPFSFNFIKNSLIEILSHRVFIGTVFVMAASYSTLLSFNTLGPFLIQITLNKSAIFFGYIALLLGLSFFSGTLFSRVLIKLFALDNILYFVIKIIFAIALSFLISSLIFGTHLALIIGHALFIFFGIGLVYPLASAKTALLFRHLAGSATSLIVFINLTINSLATTLFSIISIHSALPLAGLFTLLLATALLCFKCLARENQH